MKYWSFRGIFGFAFLIFPSNTILAQTLPDTVYIIKLEGDTLMGFTKFSAFEKSPGQISISLSDGTKLNFHPRDIEGFYIPSRQSYYVSRPVVMDVTPTSIVDMESIGYKDTVAYETLFLKKVVQGKASLYSYIDSTVRRHFFMGIGDSIKELKIYYNIHKPDLYSGINPPRLVEQDAYKTQLTNILGDCPGISTKIRDASYDENSLIKVFQYYDSHEKQAGRYQLWKGKPTTILLLGIIAGYASNILHISGHRHDASEAYGQKFIGFSLEEVFVERFSISEDFHTIRYQNSYTEPGLNLGDEISNNQFDIRYYSMDILPRYRIALNRTNMFFVESGVGLGALGYPNCKLFRIILSGRTCLG